MAKNFRSRKGGYVPLILIAAITVCAVSNSVSLTSDTTKNQLTSKEVNAIQNLRPMVAKFLTLEYHKTDAYLLVWLKDSKFDLNAAAEKIEKRYNWRKENDIDSILDKTEDIPKDLKYMIPGVDRRGHPIALFPAGKWNVRKYVISGKSDVPVRQLQRLWEDSLRTAFQKGANSGTDDKQFYFLVDLQSFNTREHMCLGCLAIYTSYSISLVRGGIPFCSNITLINTPRIFSPVLSLARRIITKLPIRDFDYNKAVWIPELTKDISPDQLPGYLQ